MLYLIRTEYAVEMYTTYGIPPDMLERWIEGIYKLCKTRQEKEGFYKWLWRRMNG
jgi:hypothetical protein